MNLLTCPKRQSRKFEFAIDMPDLEEFMSPKEAAKKLGFHLSSVQKMLKNNTLQGVRFGRAWLVSKKSVQEYIDKTAGMSKNDPRRKLTDD